MCGRAGVPFNNVPCCPFQAVLVPAPVNTFSGESQGQGATLGVSEPGLRTSAEHSPGSGSVCICGSRTLSLPWWLGQTPPLLPGAGVCSGCVREACGALFRLSTRFRKRAERDSLLKSKGLSKPCALIAPSTRGPARCPSALRTTPGWEKPFPTEVTGMNGASSQEQAGVECRAAVRTLSSSEAPDIPGLKSLFLPAKPGFQVLVFSKQMPYNWLVELMRSHPRTYSSVFKKKATHSATEGQICDWNTAVPLMCAPQIHIPELC